MSDKQGHELFSLVWAELSMSECGDQGSECTCEDPDARGCVCRCGWCVAVQSLDAVCRAYDRTRVELEQARVDLSVIWGEYGEVLRGWLEADGSEWATGLLRRLEGRGNATPNECDGCEREGLHPKHLGEICRYCTRCKPSSLTPEVMDRYQRLEGRDDD